MKLKLTELTEKIEARKKQKEYLRVWSLIKPERLNASQRWWKNKNRKKVSEWRRSNPIIASAWRSVNRAINSGKISRPDKCSKCKKKCKPQAHHEDYSKALKVDWLCRACHLAKHGKRVRVEI